MELVLVNYLVYFSGICLGSVFVYFDNVGVIVRFMLIYLSFYGVLFGMYLF